MRIGSVCLDNVTVLAPLAGITNLPFRLIAKEAGCRLVYSEMISANGLVHGSAKTLRMLDTSPKEKPISIQIFGSDPSIMAEAGAIVESSGAGILDINFGCSVKKIVKTGAGIALMREPEKAEMLIKAVRNSVKIPLSVKMRAGWDASGRQAVALARIAQDCGVDAIAIHPRTALQGFKGGSDWSLIGAVKKCVSIPVIGNGDIATAEDAHTMLKDTGCDAVMIGRAAIGNPWIFSQVNALIRGKEAPLPDLSLRFSLIERYLEASVEYLGEKHACRLMRSRLGWFVKGLPGSGKFRESVKRVSTKDEAMNLIKIYRDTVEGGKS